MEVKPSWAINRKKKRKKNLTRPIHPRFIHHSKFNNKTKYLGISEVIKAEL
jgi:hypothetical protein